MEGSTSALVPSAERMIDFYGDELAVAQSEADVYVALRAICDVLGLDWSAQRQRLQRDSVLARRAQMVVMHGADGRQREMLCLPLDLLPGWLFGIDTRRVKPELAPKLERYREECFRVLWQAFQNEVVPAAPSSQSTLAHVRAMGLAIAQLAEQQMAMESRQDRFEQRLDKAATVIGDVQRRLTEVEIRTTPAQAITDEQAAEISQQVKALAQLLGQKAGNSGRNQYQAIFGELYRRFGVSSYKLIKQTQYEAMLQFLEEWQQAADKPVQ